MNKIDIKNIRLPNNLLASDVLEKVRRIAELTCSTKRVKKNTAKPVYIYADSNTGETVSVYNEKIEKA